MSTVPPFNPDPDAPVYLYEQVADHLQARIEAGEIGPRLPGERALMDEYGVAHGTIRKATDLLRERGRVVTLPGKGTFVRKGE
ncbi:winged helix-turn-helix domain-containing protein [Amycolatopsis dongchuanensis]|uniref:HTH gntR-type domain-containing protein n=1 Tax=Amycolatopsis dongchuanensis TaxID=1070866 RepID=A0ABP8VK25_9PSEU